MNNLNSLCKVTIIASNSEFSHLNTVTKLQFLFQLYFFYVSTGCNCSQSAVALCSLEAEWSHIHSAVPSLTPEHRRQSPSVTPIDHLLAILSWPPLASVHWPSGIMFFCSLLGFQYFRRTHCRGARFGWDTKKAQGKGGVSWWLKLKQSPMKSNWKEHLVLGSHNYETYQLNLSI